jgi:hypothetical protein
MRNIGLGELVLAALEAMNQSGLPGAPAHRAVHGAAEGRVSDEALEFLSHFCAGCAANQEIVFSKREILLALVCRGDVQAAKCLTSACKGNVSLCRAVTKEDIAALCRMLHASGKVLGLVRFVRTLCESEPRLGESVLGALQLHKGIIMPCNSVARHNERWLLLQAVGADGAAARAAEHELAYHVQTTRLLAVSTRGGYFEVPESLRAGGRNALKGRSLAGALGRFGVLEEPDVHPAADAAGVRVCELAGPRCVSRREVQWAVPARGGADRSVNAAAGTNRTVQPYGGEGSACFAVTNEIRQRHV